MYNDVLFVIYKTTFPYHISRQERFENCDVMGFSPNHVFSSTTAISII